jgi:hypothetical protein
VLDANGQALVYVYARETPNEANIAGVLTFDEARCIAVNGASCQVTKSSKCQTPPSKSSIATKQILDLHKTYETEEACVNACAALEREGAIPSSLRTYQGDFKALMDYFCIQVPGK